MRPGGDESQNEVKQDLCMCKATVHSYEYLVYSTLFDAHRGLQSETPTDPMWGRQQQSKGQRARERDAGTHQIPNVFNSTS